MDRPVFEITVCKTPDDNGYNITVSWEEDGRRRTTSTWEPCFTPLGAKWEGRKLARRLWKREIRKLPRRKYVSRYVP